MKFAMFTVALLLLAGNVLADPQPWMAKENPDELARSVVAETDCPNSVGEYRETVDEILTRARIKPLLTDSMNIYLYVKMLCGFYNGKYNFSVSAQLEAEHGLGEI